MYLHRLTLQAIGPFAGHHEIDVTRLAASGLFLLEGPTGAGKSTLIDAVVFALYGKVASEAASDDRLRSAFAPPEVESFVDLVFETPSGLYRVRRSPEYQRPKKRGTGTTTQQAAVTLWRLGRPLEDLGPRDAAGSTGAEGGLDAAPGADPLAGGELMSSRLDEAGEEIRRIVGLDRTQFVQTVVLPQGEFARFLRADPEDRGKLLQKVFGTELYDRIAVRLADLRKAANRRVEDAKGSAVGAVEHFIGASATTGDDADALRAAVEELTEEPDALDRLVTVVVDRLTDTTAALADHEAEATTTLATARAGAAAAEAALAAALRLVDLLTRAGELDDAEPVITATRDRIAAHGRAQAVAVLVVGARTAADAVVEATERREAARADLPAAVADAEPATWEDQRARTAAARTRLARVEELGAGVPAREDLLAEERADQERDTTARDRIVADLDARPTARAVLDAAHRDATATAQGLPALTERLTRAEAVRDAVATVARLAGELDRAEAVLRAATSEADAAVREESRLRSARIAGMAGELAASLSAGDPCPVCGAGDHPHPADRGVDPVGEEEVTSAERHRAIAEEALRAAVTHAAALRERLEAERRATGGGDAGTAARDVEAAAELVAAAHRAATDRDALADRLDAMDAETTALTRESALLAERIAVRATRVEEMERSLAADLADIDGELAAARPLVGVDVPDDAPPCPAGHPGGRDEEPNPVAALSEALTARETALTVLIDADASARAAEAMAATRADEVAAAAEGHGFADPDAALAALLGVEEHEDLRETVATHDGARAAVHAGLADLPDAPGGVEDARDAVTEAGTAVEASRKTVEEATATVREATGHHGSAERLLAAARTAAVEVDRAAARWASAREGAGPVVRMADLAGGLGADNPARLSLATFVLVRRFEDVVAAANERLTEMSAGRYELAHTTAREAVRSRRTGLALTVVDHVAELSRDPRTLSGGETFYVSLCLALGLADVVTAEAGGVELGTLFVDEGFGSLDPGTLDVVLAELGRLREGGRVVGVVSHVEALKQAIAERVEVRPVRGGGSTLTVRA